jgi:hypothetical protein
MSTNKKIDRELNGPSWTEVIVGAVLSLLLGVVLGAALLVFRPVATVKELPKEPDADTVYFVPGTSDATKARQAQAKQKAFLEGGSVVLNEDEVNVLTAPAAKPGAKPAAPSGQTLASGAPNFRIRHSVLQVAVPLTVNVAGFQHEILVQARGGFAKDGDSYVFTPTEFYVGSCPVQRLPVVESLITKRLLAAAPEADALVAAWRKLAEVAVEDSTLRLSMP